MAKRLNSLGSWRPNVFVRDLLDDGLARGLFGEENQLVAAGSEMDERTSGTGHGIGDPVLWQTARVLTLHAVDERPDSIDGIYVNLGRDHRSRMDSRSTLPKGPKSCRWFASDSADDRRSDRR